MTTFADLGVPTALAACLAEQGITSPFPIQTATLPDSLAGRDVLGRGRTGSGKTLAFALPLVARLTAQGSSSGRARSRRPRGLVLCPTRELANQIDAVLAPLAAAAGLRTTTIFGGVSQSRQVSALDAGVDIVVACPGRLEDLLNQKVLTLDQVAVTVLDEADHMADLGFLPGVKRILDRTPAGGQRMLFSATLDNGVDIIVRRYLSNPVHHSVDSAESPVAQMTHHVLEVADAAAKLAVVRQLAGGTGRRVLFLRTKHQAKKLAKQLVAEGIAAVDLHGNLGQAARERNLAAFGSGEATVLVATDIAARGIHVDDVELVVHVDPPAEHKAYLHRSGRTARAGAEGVVVTLVLPEQRADVRAMTRAAKITAQPRHVTPGDATVGALAGEPAPRRAVPVAAPVEASTGAGGSSRRSGGGGRGGRGGRGAATTGRTTGAAAPSSRQGRTRRGPAASPVFTTSSPSRASSPSSASSTPRGSSAPSASRATPAAAGAPAQRSTAPRHSRRASAPAGTPRTLGERSWRA
jgi:superfamily II DNA/RNA helicase